MQSAVDSLCRPHGLIAIAHSTRDAGGSTAHSPGPTRCRAGPPAAPSPPLPYSASSRQRGQVRYNLKWESQALHGHGLRQRRQSLAARVIAVLGRASEIRDVLTALSGACTGPVHAHVWKRYTTMIHSGFTDAKPWSWLSRTRPPCLRGRTDSGARNSGDACLMGRGAGGCATIRGPMPSKPSLSSASRRGLGGR